MRATLSIALLFLASCSAAPRFRQAPAPASPPTATGFVADEAMLRRARVAIPRDALPAKLVYFATDLADSDRAALARIAPRIEFVVGLSNEQALARASEAHAADVRYASADFIRAATNLRWVQAHSAGVDRYLSRAELVKSDRIVFTNMRGVHGPAIADHVFAGLLALTRNLPGYWQNQQRARWGNLPDGAPPSIALHGRTLLVVGLGGIGTEIARRGHGFGMRVWATRRSDAAAPDFVERCERPDKLLELLPEVDVVAIAVPLTSDTERLFDARAFDALKPGAYLVNIARGKVVDTAALVAALKSGRLAGAALDVTDPEPLPEAHELWKLANVVITPHVAADAELTEARHAELCAENARRFGAGEPLLNVVDGAAGY
ncbi:MAG: D-2-hydroxyacid dehydrogenase [Planctomycetota bacterium]|nr:MAG: D-2-hydroxyacid dehydrogenase [Planctomycetota bacterium]